MILKNKKNVRSSFILILALLYTAHIYGNENHDVVNAVEVAPVQVVIPEPSLGDGIRILSRSSKDGTCRAFGYERAITKNPISEEDYLGPYVVIKEETSRVAKGNTEELEMVSVMKSITCLKQSHADASPIESTTLIVNPEVNCSCQKEEFNLSVDASSSESDLCIKLGFDGHAWSSLSKEENNQLRIKLSYDNICSVVGLFNRKTQKYSPIPGHSVKAVICTKDLLKAKLY